MKTTIEKIALKYRDGILCPESHSDHNNRDLVLMFQAEVMRLGYIFDEVLFDHLAKFDEAVIQQIYRNVVPVLWDLKGADKKWKIFYPKFPKQVMKASDTELFLNAICHYWSFGTWMPSYAPSRRLPKMEKTKFTSLSLVTEKDCMTVFSDLLGSNISLSESDLQDLEWFVLSYGERLSDYVPDQIPFKETLCSFVGLSIQNKLSFASASLKTATDVLRVMTHLSGGDVSLAENTKFSSWKRSQRKLFLEALEPCVREDDIARHGNKWKRAFHGLHLGDYAKKFPKTYAIAQELRNGKLRTFSGRVEKAIVENDADALFKLLSSRPGELARRLDHLLRTFDQKAKFQLLDVFDKLAKKVDTRVLVQLLGHFKERSFPTTQRLVMPKGTQAKARILKKVLPALSEEIVEKLSNSISSALLEKFAAKDSLGKVWIDPALKKCPVPLAQRSAAESLRSVARGTRLALSDKSTLRLFVWWVGHDVDLSCVLYDEKFSEVDHISYTNLRNKDLKCCHSGDITYAPKGAAEFIDIDMKTATKAGIRYVMMNVLDFTGLKFSGHKECFAGWMTRDYPNKNEVYDPKTVEQKIDLRTPTRLAAPVLFDLVEREAIWLDLSGRVKGRLPNNVESNAATIVDLAQSAMLLSEKFNLYELFELHALARGESVEDKESADSVFSLEEGITPFDITKIAAEFLA